MKWCGHVFVLVACVVLVAATGAAFGDGAVAALLQGTHRPFNARAWGMGGASTALAEGADGLLANPAGPAFTDGAQAMLASTSLDLVLSAGMYDPAEGSIWEEAQGSDSQWGVAYSGSTQSGGGQVSAWGLAFADADGGNSFSLAVAGRRSERSKMAAGISMRHPSGGDLSFAYGFLYRTPGGFSLGLNLDQAPGGLFGDLLLPTVGAAYEGENITLAVDFFDVIDNVLEDGCETLMGAEFRVGEGMALRVGSARGNLTYGVGYQKNGWSLDYAHISMEEEEELIPGVEWLRADVTLDVISLSYNFPSAVAE